MNNQSSSPLTQKEVRKRLAKNWRVQPHKDFRIIATWTHEGILTEDKLFTVWAGKDAVGLFLAKNGRVYDKTR